MHILLNMLAEVPVLHSAFPWSKFLCELMWCCFSNNGLGKLSVSSHENILHTFYICVLAWVIVNVLVVRCSAASS
jgi:hypothetical protein